MHGVNLNTYCTIPIMMFHSIIQLLRSECFAVISLQLRQAEKPEMSSMLGKGYWS